MRADYATSDLINKVNSDWINEVLANREFGRAGPADDIRRDDVAAVRGDNADAGDLRLRREFDRKRTIMLRRGTARSEHWEPGNTDAPTARPSRRRSLARRVKERLALAVALLTLVGLGLWMAAEPPDATNSASTQATNALPEPAAPISTAAVQPAWLLPEILYGPAMARSPVPRTEAPRPQPKPGH
jgi:hypothetical protein